MKLSDEVFIYGTGLTARHVYELLGSQGKYTVKAFLNRSLDQYNCVSQYKECWLYTDKRITEEIKNNSSIVVGITNTKGDITGVMETLKREGFKNIIPYAALADVFPGEFQFLYLEDSGSFEKRMPHVMAAREILVNSGADKRSLEVFDSMVDFRRTKNYHMLPEIDKKEDQYFPKDIEEYRTEAVGFIDCGAYTGDTFEALLKWDQKVNSLEFYAGFEPDKISFGKLKDMLEREEYKNIKYKLYPYAVCECNRELFFDMIGTTASKVQSNKQDSTCIKGVALDEILFPAIPTHIKMDIEGEERNALMGAKNLIHKHKPKLAICIYHKPEDIYDIICLIHSWNLGYSFEMRVYEDVGVDLVLYAV